MSNKKKATQQDKRPLTAVEVGRYLKRLSALQKDSLTGNRALSEALQEISDFLTPLGNKTIEQALTGSKPETEKPDEVALNKPLSYDISLKEISGLLENKDITRAELVQLGAKRFGIAESKLNKLSRESAVKTIRAALEHEQSIEILSNEASKGGQSRTS